MADATNTDPAVDAVRASFTIALHTATDLVIQAANTTADARIDLVGAIGRSVLAHLLSTRRLRVCPPDREQHNQHVADEIFHHLAKR